MHPPEETCWTLIRGAAGGRSKDREEFARRYLPAVRAYLLARWRHSSLRSEVDDVVQEVFLACFREGGALDRVDPDHASGFRAFLFSVSRNVALRAERTLAQRAKRVNGEFNPSETPADDTTLSRIFDREYAAALMRDARERMAWNAQGEGEASVRRVELLRLRFEDGLPIREIATRWKEDPARVHREYARAREEFKAALAKTVADSERCSAAKIEEECSQLLRLLRP